MQVVDHTDEHAFYVDGWLIQPTLHRLSRNGTVRQLEPKGMQVLCRLAETPQRVVSKEDLLDTVWADTIVVDKTLTRSISNLRKAFDDDARDPHVIETIPRAGYRLIAPVSYEGVDVPPADGAAARADRRAVPWKRTLQGAVVVLVAVAAAGVAWSLKGERAYQPARPRQLTSYQGSEVFPALSPSGEAVAFSWNGEEGDNWDLYVLGPDVGKPLRRTTDPAVDWLAAWSPDGTRIAFARRGNGACALYVMPALAGPEREIAPCGGALSTGLAWSPDGRQLALSLRAEGDDAYRIYLLTLATGVRQPVSSPPEGMLGDVDPRFSPDGSKVTFTRTRGFDVEDLYVVSIDGTGERRLTDDNRDLYGHDWTPDGRFIVFSSNRMGPFDLWRIPAAGGEAQWLPASGWNLKRPTFDRNGRLVYENWLYDTNLMRVDLAADTHITPFVASSLWELHPSIAPDGRHVAFVSNRSGAYEVWISDDRGMNQTRLTYFNGAIVSSPRWSPDGRRLVVDVRLKAQADVYAIDVDDGSTRRLTGDPDDDIAPRWSSDGRWVYFGSRRTGQWQLWRVPAGGGDATQVTTQGGLAGTSTARGLFYVKNGEPGLWRRLPGDTQETHLVEALQPGDWANWVLADDGIYFVRRADATEIAFYRFDDASTSVVAALHVPILMHEPGLSVARDGTWLVFTQFEKAESDLMIAEPATDR